MSELSGDPRKHPAVVGSRLRARWPLLMWGLAVVVFLLLLNHLQGGITLSGVVMKDRVTIQAPFDGRIERWEVKAGDTVSEGQMLGNMDEGQARAGLRAEEARWAEDRDRRHLDDQRLRLQVSQTRLQASVDAAEQRQLMQAAEAEGHQVQAEIERLEPLVERRLTDPADLADLRMRRDRLQAEQEGASLVLASLQELSQWATAQEQAIQPPTEVRREDVVAEYTWQISQCKLTAPRAGRIGPVLAEAGQSVLAGTPLLEVVSPVSSRVLAFLPEARARDVQPGMRFTITSSRTPGIEGEGAVVEVLADIVGLETGTTLMPRQVTRGRYVMLELVEGKGLLPGESVILRQGRSVIRHLQDLVQAGRS